MGTKEGGSSRRDSFYVACMQGPQQSKGAEENREEPCGSRLHSKYKAGVSYPWESLKPVAHSTYLKQGLNIGNRLSENF